MQRTLVFCRENAQLGNRLIVYAHLLAATRVCGWRMVNPTFEPYADLFTGTCSRPHGRCLMGVRAAWQVGKLLAPLSGGLLARARARGAVEIDLTAVMRDVEQRGARWLLIQGYRIRCPEWVAQEAEAVRRFFMPIDQYRLPAESLVADLRQRGEIVIGVHIRHGDYAQHLGGRYFYSFAQYAGLMRQVQNLFASRRCVFLICTHVPFPAEVFSEFVWAQGPGTPAADLHALSRCDHILGPPSSFSAWAAFHGASQLCHVTHPEQTLTVAGFLPQPAPDSRD